MIRVGTGYDLHRLEKGRKLILGGIHLPHSKGLLGHSDADVLSHAITDAILGAAAMGNIGQMFPDTDPAYKDADSIRLLRQAYDRVRDAGYSLVNVDATVIAQKPKLNPHVNAIRKSLAAALELDPRAVSVKGKTNEGLGPEGREEAISAHAVVLLRFGE